MKQLELEAKQSNRRQARENARDKVTIGRLIEQVAQNVLTNHRAKLSETRGAFLESPKNVSVRKM